MTAETQRSDGSPREGARRASTSLPIRLILVIAGLLACLFGIWSSGREGLAQLLAAYGAAANRMDAADRAVELGAAVPEAHYVRAVLLTATGARAEAIEEYERAVALRPHDYALWLELGLARDQAGDGPGASAAFKEAIRLAPFYAAPRWQLGNMLYRAGRLDEAFAELRQALRSDPKLLPQTLELAWAAFGGDAGAVRQALQPETPSQHLGFARFFSKHGKTNEAIAEFRAAGNASDEERRALLETLLAAKRFSEAYEVWASGHQTDGLNPSPVALVLNGGFETPVTLNDPGFGWQFAPNTKAVQAAQDKAEPHTGAQSLLLTWSGAAADAAAPVLSQLVLVEPNVRYQLRFAARTYAVVSGGLPVVIVSDAGDGRTPEKEEAAATLPQGTNPWQDYFIEFTTGSATNAVRLSVRRQNCSSQPCPIFGRVWLDDFSMRRIGSGK